MAPLEFVFQEQSYSHLHSGQSLAWDHFLGDIADPCSVIADFCGVITQSAEYVKYAKIFGDYFWLIFISTEGLGDPFLVILCLLKILATISSWFYAYWRSWRLIFVWKPSMAVFAYSYWFSMCVSLQSLVCQTTYSRWYKWSDFTLSTN